MKNFISILIMLISGLTMTSLKAQDSWTLQTNPVSATADVGKIQFVNATEGWISISNGGLLHTVNGGLTWTEVALDLPEVAISSMIDPAFNMCFINASTGWVMKSFGTDPFNSTGAVVYKTTNGGLNWQKVILSQEPKDMGGQIQFIDEYNGYASIVNTESGLGKYYKTIDGGANWSLMPTDGTVGILNQVDLNNFWAILGTFTQTPPYIILHSDNGMDASFTQQLSDNSPGAFWAIQFTDLNHGWVVGQKGKILKTVNGGVDWTVVTNAGITSDYTCKSVYFINATTGWIGAQLENSSDNAIVLHTTDGGTSWTTQSTPTYNPYSIFFWDANHGWLSSDDNKIARFGGNAYPSIGIIGSALNVLDDVDIDMQTTDGINYTLSNYPLIAGWVKFRQDNSWSVNWGDSAFPSGTGTQDGQNIPIPGSGNYDITFNITTGAYSFECVSNCNTFNGIIGIMGSALNSVDIDIDMLSTDGIIYTLKSYTFKDGSAKFRKDNSWTINWGSSTFPSGTGTQNGPDIPVIAGTYDVTFDILTGDYSFSYPSIGILGDALSGGWENDIDLQTTDGINYTLVNYPFNNGGVKFRQDNGWSVNWGSDTFPSGIGVQAGPNIPVTSGIYDLTFNRLTGEYAFTQTYSNATLIGPWFGYLNPLDPYNEQFGYLVFDGSGNIIDGSQFPSQTTGTYVVNPDGSFTANIINGSMTVLFEGQLSSPTAAIASAMGMTFNFHKIANPGALKDKIAGYLSTPSGCGRKDVTLNIDDNGNIISATGLAGPVTGRVYADLGVFLGHIKTGEAINGWHLFSIKGYYNNNNLIGQIEFDWTSCNAGSVANLVRSDNTADFTTCPANKAVNTDAENCTAIVNAIDPVVNPIGAEVSYTLSGATTGNGSGSASGKDFNKGETMVTYTMVDDATKTCSFTVTVTDNQAPVLTCTSNQTLNVIANTCAANYTIADPISDNCTSSTWGYTLTGATTAMVYGIADGTGSGILSFKRGVTTITLTGTDATNSATACSFTVTVLDDQKPTITAPETVIVTADTGKCTASGVTLGTPTIGDNCMIANVTNDAVEPFALGNTTVLWTITDGSGNTATATQTVTVNPNITIGTVSGTTPLCMGATATYTSNGDAGGAWSSSNTSVATVNVSGLVTTWSAGTTEITYTLSGCTEPISANKTLTVDPAIGATIFTTGATALCQDAANETYTATAEDSSAIVYSVLPITAGTIGANSGVMNWDTAFSGNATITATATGLCGTTTADRIVVVNPLPVVNAGSPSTIIPGNSVAIGTVAEEGNAYSWVSNPAGFTSAVANPTVSPIVTTTYTLTIWKTATACTNSDSVTITVANLLPMANAGADKTVYYGYPPSQCTTLYGSASGGTPPYQYSWSNGVVTASTSVCPTTTMSYILTVTDANGFSVTDDVTVNVIDVSCGNNKVKVCHENKTLCIAIPAVKVHLAHGDSLGDCANNSSIAVNTANTNSMVFYPNPTAGSFTVEVYKNNVVEKAILKVVDFNGNIIYAKAPFRIDGFFKETIQLNHSLPDGIYFLQLISDEKTETKELIFKK